MHRQRRRNNALNDRLSEAAVYGAVRSDTSGSRAAPGDVSSGIAGRHAKDRGRKKNLFHSVPSLSQSRCGPTQDRPELGMQPISSFRATIATRDTGRRGYRKTNDAALPQFCHGPIRLTDTKAPKSRIWPVFATVERRVWPLSAALLPEFTMACRNGRTGWRLRIPFDSCLIRRGCRRGRLWKSLGRLRGVG